jgi:hydrogenase-4 component E
VQQVLVAILLATAVLTMGIRRLDSAVWMIAMQSALLGVIAASVAYTSGVSHIYVAAFLTVLIKAVLVPWVLIRFIRKLSHREETQAYLRTIYALIVACGLVILAYDIARSFIGKHSLLSVDILAASLALVLLGLFIMVGKRHAFMQIMGLLVMENGLYLLAVSTAKGMPLVVELGIFLDLIVGIVVMGSLLYRINRTFASADTEQLKTLRG